VVSKQKDETRICINIWPAQSSFAPQDRTFDMELGPVYDAFDRFSEGEWRYEEALRFDPKFLVRKPYKERLARWQQARESTAWMPSSED
jgi:hypothetical protein